MLVSYTPFPSTVTAGLLVIGIIELRNRMESRSHFTSIVPSRGLFGSRTYQYDFKSSDFGRVTIHKNGIITEIFVD